MTNEKKAIVEEIIANCDGQIGVLDEVINQNLQQRAQLLFIRDAVRLVKT